MSGNVKPLRPGDGDDLQPVPHVVEVLERMLAMAKRGEIVELAGAAMMNPKAGASNVFKFNPMYPDEYFTMLGALQDVMFTLRHHNEQINRDG